MKRLLVSLASALALVLLVSSPAAAADEIGLSTDGVTFTPDLGGPLFDPAVKWVPGDSRSATFYVRNQGGSQARLTVDILGAHTGALLDSGDLHVTATAGGAVTAIASDGSEHRLLTLDDVDDGQIIAVTVTVRFDFSSPNATQLQSTDLRFRVNLTQSGSDQAGIIGAGALPDTGGPVAWLAALAAICLGGGGLLLLRRTTNTEGASL